MSVQLRGLLPPEEETLMAELKRMHAPYIFRIVDRSPGQQNPPFTGKRRRKTAAQRRQDALSSK